MKKRRRRCNTAVIIARELVLEEAGKLSPAMQPVEVLKFMESLDEILNELFQKGVVEGKKMAQKPCDN